MIVIFTELRSDLNVVLIYISVKAKDVEYFSVYILAFSTFFVLLRQNLKMQFRLD